MFEKNNIELSREMDSSEDSRARFFPATGGIIKTLSRQNPEYTYLDVSGVEKCKGVLNDISKGNVHHCFIEMSACAGGCIGGPIMEKYYNSPVQHYQSVVNYAGKNDFNIPQPQENFLVGEYNPIEVKRNYPTDQEINNILRQMGKYKPSDELNCGSCGYDTCREKAVAIFQGKSEIDMCLPYLMEKSERFSNNIIDNAPSGILVVNDALEVQLINPSAMKMLNIASRSDVMGEPLIRILDPLDFINVRNTGETLRDKREYYAEFDKYLEMTIVHDKSTGNLISLFRDVSKEEKEIQSKKILGQQTIETADKVVDKQMRIVQEIASLLGETAAETKIALTKLKESIPHEDEE